MIKDIPEMKIIAFGDCKYKRIALNWAKHLEKLNIKNYTVISLDKKIFNFLTKHGINAELLELDMFGGRENRSWWTLRFQVMYDKLLESNGIIHSDLDAVWLKNPEKFIDYKYDIISSSGNMPRRIYDELNLSLCMGWVFFKNNDKVKKIFKDILSSEKAFDDQVALNNYLMDQKISHKSDIGLDSEKIIFGNIKTRFLNQNIISRHKPHTQNTYIDHPYIKTKNIKTRESILKQKGLWIDDGKS